MFTRSITTFEAKAVSVEFDGMEPKVIELGHAVYMGTRASETEARKALKAAGVQLKRGCKVFISEVETVVYGCTIDQFMTVAHPVEVKAEADAE